MPDRMVEDARNVTINLHGEHGKFVMIQLFFSDKWMLISEITFTSSESFNVLNSTSFQISLLCINWCLERRIEIPSHISNSRMSFY